MLKLTDLEGRVFFVRMTAITVLREPNPGEYALDAKAVVEIAGKSFAVKDPLRSLALSLGVG